MLEVMEKLMHLRRRMPRQKRMVIRKETPILTPKRKEIVMQTQMLMPKRFQI
jgi:hypothetical protein